MTQSFIQITKLILELTVFGELTFVERRVAFFYSLERSWKAGAAWLFSCIQVLFLERKIFEVNAGSVKHYTQIAILQISNFLYDFTYSQNKSKDKNLFYSISI